MSRKLDDRVRPGEARAPSKGAMAAERASAGVGTSDDDESLVFAPPSPGVDVWAKREAKDPRAARRVR